jgi:hypothetical protein
MEQERLVSFSQRPMLALEVFSSLSSAGARLEWPSQPSNIRTMMLAQFFPTAD